VVSGPSARILDEECLMDYDDAKVQKGDSMAATSVVIKNVSADYDFFDTYQIVLASAEIFPSQSRPMTRLPSS